MEAHLGRGRIWLSLALLAAALAAYGLSRLIPFDNRAVPNVVFAIEVVFLSLIFRKRPLSWTAINFAIARFIVIAILAFVVAAFLIQTNREIARFIGSPVFELGYYPPGGHVPIVIGAPIWAVSIYLICVGAFLIGRMLSAARSKEESSAGPAA